MTTCINASIASGIILGLGRCGLPWERDESGVTQGSLLLAAASSDYTTLASAAAQMPATDKMTLVGWIKVTAWPADTAAMGVVAKADYGVSSSYGLRIGSSSSGDVLNASMAAVGNEAYGNASNSIGGRYTAPPVGIWCQLAWVFDGAASGTARSTLYVNTNPLAKGNYTGNQPADIITNSTSAFEFGNVKASGTRGSFLGARLSSWYLYDRALSEAELRAHMAGSAPSDFVLSFPFALGAGSVTLGGSARIEKGGRPAFQQVLRVHCIGDSITLGQEASFHATAWRGGWRRLVANTLAASGIFMRGVGSVSSVHSYLSEHDGVSAGLVTDLIAKATGSAALTPDVVTVAVGTNNARSGQPTSHSQTRADFETLLDELFTGQAPYTILIPPPPLPAETALGKVYVLGINSYVRNVLAPERAAAGDPVYAVEPDYDGSTDLEDDVHCNATGNGKIEAVVSPVIISRPTQGDGPAHAARAALRAAATVEFLYSGACRPTETSGKVSSRLDLHTSDEGTGSHTMTQGTAAARPLWDGMGDQFRAGQDDATADSLELAAGDLISASAPFTVGVLAWWLYSPALDANGGHEIAALERQAAGTVQRLLVRTLDAGSTFRLYLAGSANNTAKTWCTVPWTHSTASFRRIVYQYTGGDQSLAASHAVWLEGVSQTVSTSAVSCQSTYNYGAIGKVRAAADNFFHLGADLMEFVVCAGTSAGTLSAVNAYLTAMEPRV